jgi:hypothetical protein
LTKAHSAELRFEGQRCNHFIGKARRGRVRWRPRRCIVNARFAAAACWGSMSFGRGGISCAGKFNSELNFGRRRKLIPLFEQVTCNVPTVTPSNPAISSLLLPSATKFLICSSLSAVNLLALRLRAFKIFGSAVPFASSGVLDATLLAARSHRCSNSKKCVFWDGIEAISAERFASQARRYWRTCPKSLPWRAAAGNAVSDEKFKHLRNFLDTAARAGLGPLSAQKGTTPNQIGLDLKRSDVSRRIGRYSKFQITEPDWSIRRASSPPQGKQKQGLASGSKARMVGQCCPSTRENEDGDTPASYLKKNLRQSGLQYQRITRSFFAISMEREGTILYSRCNFSRSVRRAIHCFDLVYPQAEKRAWDPVVTRISLSLRPLER